MNCTPISSEYADYIVQPLAQKIRKAKKEHKCTECKESISTGSSYEYFAGKDDDGNLFIQKTCDVCLELRTHFSSDGGWIWGSIWRDIIDNFFPDMRAGGPCLEGLSAKAKMKLVNKFKEYKGLSFA